MASQQKSLLQRRTVAEDKFLRKKTISKLCQVSKNGLCRFGSQGIFSDSLSLLQRRTVAEDKFLRKKTISKLCQVSKNGLCHFSIVYILYPKKSLSPKTAESAKKNFTAFQSPTPACWCRGPVVFSFSSFPSLLFFALLFSSPPAEGFSTRLLKGRRGLARRFGRRRADADTATSLRHCCCARLLVNQCTCQQVEELHIPFVDLVYAPTLRLLREMPV